MMTALSEFLSIKKPLTNRLIHSLDIFSVLLTFFEVLLKNPLRFKVVSIYRNFDIECGRIRYYIGILQNVLIHQILPDIYT